MLPCGCVLIGFCVFVHVRNLDEIISDIRDINDSGSLASLTISNNKIGSEQEAKIKEICAGKSIKCTL